MLDLSIIIVTYNSESDIKNCIDSIIKQTSEISYEICIVDNSSTDSTVNIVKEQAKDNKFIKLICTDNRGFNAGNNIGIKNTDSTYIALLNPDTIVVNNAFKIIIDGLKVDKNIGAAGACLLTQAGDLNTSSGSFPSFYDMFIRTLKLRKDSYYIADVKQEKMRVQFPIGADFVFRRELIDEIGYLDERYFLYFDETDYAYSIYQKGYKNYLFTKAKIIHLQGKSTENTSEFAQKKFLESHIIYMKKHLSNTESILTVRFKITELLLKITLIKPFKKQQQRRYLIYSDELKYYRELLKGVKS